MIRLIKKWLVWSVCLFSVISCSQQGRNDAPQKTFQSNDDEPSNGDKIEKVAEVPDPNTQIIYKVPEIELDSIIEINSVKGYQMTCIFPKLLVYSDYEFTTIYKEFIDSIVTSFKDSIDSTSFTDGPSLLEINPKSFTLTDEISSVCFSIYHYASGAVHGYTKYLSINWDNHESRIIHENEYLNRTHLNDTSLTKELMKKYPEDVQSLFYDQSSVTLGSFTDFTILEDSISLNFGSYDLEDYASGIIRLVVSNNDLGDALSK